MTGSQIDQGPESIGLGTDLLCCLWTRPAAARGQDVEALARRPHQFGVGVGGGCSGDGSHGVVL